MRISSWTKGLVFGIMFMLCFIAIYVPATAQTTIVTNDPVPKNIFDLHSYIDITWRNGTNEPLEPGGSPRIITLDIRYGITRGVFGQFILSYYMFTQQYITVSLELEDIPRWCTASLLNSQLWFRITDTPSGQSTTLAIAVDETAPAFEPFSIKLHASVDDVRGPFGILRIIQGYENTFSMSFIADYFPRIVVTPDSNYIETKPGAEVVSPISVKNLGNGDTMVFASIMTCPDGWLLVITDQVELAVNENKSMQLYITPPRVINTVETIVLQFTPHYHENYNKKGEPVYISISVHVKLSDAYT